jgi:hypothetical protein
MQNPPGRKPKRRHRRRANGDCFATRSFNIPLTTWPSNPLCTLGRSSAKPGACYAKSTAMHTTAAHSASTGLQTQDRLNSALACVDSSRLMHLVRLDHSPPRSRRPYSPRIVRMPTQRRTTAPIHNYTDAEDIMLEDESRENTCIPLVGKATLGTGGRLDLARAGIAARMTLSDLGTYKLPNKAHLTRGSHPSYPSRPSRTSSPSLPTYRASTRFDHTSTQRITVLTQTHRHGT